MTLLLDVKDASITFGGKPLFSDLGFSVESGDKICLIGKNGSGKSTLIKMIMGELELDEGTRFVHPHIRIGYVSQRFDSEPHHKTVYDYMLTHLPDHMDPMESRFMADKILSHFYLDGEMELSILSGGQRRRASLGRALMEEPDLLLLDEPTNHLDLAAIEWLEGYLRSYAGACICISHDRRFLSNITHKTFWLNQGKILVNGKGYSDFERWSEEVEAFEVARIRKMGKLLDKENHWLQYGVTARRKRNVQRLSALHDLRDKVKREKSLFMQSRAGVRLPPLSDVQATKMLVEMEDVSHSFDQKVILDKFSTRIMRKDRIGILGANGSGKSTFLNIITGRLKPDSGMFRRGFTAKKFEDEVTYFDQNRSVLNPDKTLWETLCPTGGDRVKVGKGDRHVVGYLKNFMFDPKQAKTKVGILSGGEASRLLLAKMLANPGSVLILDEPTNDLDMDTLDMLEEMLTDYPGTLLLVSHDRDFVDRVVTRTLVFEGDGEIHEVVGGYSDYIREYHKERLSASDTKQQKEKQATKKKNKSEKLSYKHRFALENMPKKIEALQKEVATIQEALSDPDLYISDAKKFDTLSALLEKKKEEIAECEAGWLEAEMKREEIEGND